MSTVQVIVTEKEIDFDMVARWNPSAEHGASNAFLGFVRNLNLGKSVIAVEYDCFKPMCEKVFNQIANEAKSKWGDDSNILIVHRHGRLSVGEASVAIVVTTGHRDESYRSSRYIIEEIKTRAPIWKKEFYVDGQTEWVRGHALCQHRKVNHHEEHSWTDSCGGTVHSHETR